MENHATITLTLTETCNLNCVYCYEHSKTPKLMDYQTAINILETELNSTSSPYEFYNVDLFGGEPFIAFDLIKKIVDYASTHKFKKKFRFDISTNGTLVHGDIKNWLIAHKDKVTCGLSLDGERESHNANRSNSFDLIDLDFFKQTYPNVPIKMTISETSLKNLYNNVVFCHSKGFKVFNNLAYGIDWSNCDNVQILQSELMKLIEYYLMNPNIEPCSMLGDPISQIAANQSTTTIRSWCAAGIQSCAYDCDGKKYPCQFFMPLSAGKKFREFNDIKFENKIPKNKLDYNCQQCVALSACPTCLGYNYVTTNNLYKRDINICALFKIILHARAYFNAQRWNKGLLNNLSSIEEQALLRSIVLINNSL